MLNIVLVFPSPLGSGYQNQMISPLSLRLSLSLSLSLIFSLSLRLFLSPSGGCIRFSEIHFCGLPRRKGLTTACFPLFEYFPVDSLWSGTDDGVEREGGALPQRSARSVGLCG